MFLGTTIANPFSEKAAPNPSSVETEATFCLYFLLNLPVFGNHKEPPTLGGDATSQPPFFRDNEAIANAVFWMTFDEIIAQYSVGNLTSICSVNIISLISFLGNYPAVSPSQSHSYLLGGVIRALGERMHWGVIGSNDIVYRLCATPMRRAYLRPDGMVLSIMQEISQGDLFVQRLQDQHSLSPWYRLVNSWIIDLHSMDDDLTSVDLNIIRFDPPVRCLSRVASLSLDKHGATFISEDVYGFLYRARSLFQFFLSELNPIDSNRRYVLLAIIREILTEITELLEKIEGMYG